MSYLGRDVIRHLRHGEDAIERLGGPLPWEVARIRAGDWSPIVRRLEPAFEVGGRFVISSAHHRPQLVRDDARRPTGEVVPRRRLPRLIIEVADVRRTAKGGWAVPFHVEDRRDPVRRLRRIPPVVELDPVDPNRELTPGEELKASRESAYGGAPQGAVDDLEGVDDLTLRRFAAEARAIEIAVAGHHDHRDAERRRGRQSLERDLADALAEAERMGVDTTSVRFVTERAIARLRRRLERAA